MADPRFNRFGVDYGTAQDQERAFWDTYASASEPTGPKSEIRPAPPFSLGQWLWQQALQREGLQFADRTIGRPTNAEDRPMAIGDFGVIPSLIRAGDAAYASSQGADMSGTIGDMTFGLVDAFPAAALGRSAVRGILSRPSIGEQAAQRFLVDEAGSVPLGRVDPAAQRGDEVLGLISSGRAAEVTDEMLDMGDPVLNARLNEYLFNNYDLPMDEASRMARADQRWPDDAYHATGTDFQAFDPLKRGTATDAGWFGDADYFSPNPAYAGKFVAGNPNGRIIPVRLNKGNTYDWRAGEIAAGRSGRGLGNNADAAMQTRARLEAEGYSSVDVANQIIKTDGPLSDEMWTSMVATDPQIVIMGRDNVSRSLQAGIPRNALAGYYQPAMIDLLPVQRTVEETAIFDPRNIRSRFARFDPRLAHLRNLNAALGGLAVGGGLLNQYQDQQWQDRAQRAGLI